MPRTEIAVSVNPLLPSGLELGPRVSGTLMPAARSSARLATSRSTSSAAHLDHPYSCSASHAASRRGSARVLRLSRRHQVDHASERKRDEIHDVRADRHLPLEAAAGKAPVVGQRLPQNAFGFGRIAPQKPRQPAHRPRSPGARRRHARRSARAAAAPLRQSSTPPRAGPLRPCTIAVTTPCSVRMSCCVGSMRWKMLRRLTLMVSRFSSGRKNSAFSNSRSRSAKKASSCCLARRRRFLRHGERQFAVPRA